MPSQTSSRERQSVCAIILPNEEPLANRRAIEYGSATPTRNEKDGWIVSCREQPAHSTWLWLNAKNPQNQLPGNARATLGRRNTSAIISSITKPRYASTAVFRPAVTGSTPGPLACGTAPAIGCIFHPLMLTLPITRDIAPYSGKKPSNAGLEQQNICYRRRGGIPSATSPRPSWRKALKMRVPATSNRSSPLYIIAPATACPPTALRKRSIPFR